MSGNFQHRARVTPSQHREARVAKMQWWPVAGKGVWGGGLRSWRMDAVERGRENGYWVVSGR